MPPWTSGEQVITYADRAEEIYQHMGMIGQARRTCFSPWVQLHLSCKFEVASPSTHFCLTTTTQVDPCTVHTRDSPRLTCTTLRHHRYLTLWGNGRGKSIFAGHFLADVSTCPVEEVQPNLNPDVSYLVPAHASRPNRQVRRISLPGTGTQNILSGHHPRSRPGLGRCPPWTVAAFYQSPSSIPRLSSDKFSTHLTSFEWSLGT
jgi:hypothetical protein